MKPKAFFLTTLMFVTLLICPTGINAQTTTSKLDQIKLRQQMIGTWEATADKDTLWVMEQQEYGKAFTANVYYTVKGNKSPYYISSTSFDSKEGKFKGFTLNANGNYSTSIGLFTTEKKYSIDVVQNFKPEMVLRKVEWVFETPTSMIETRFNATGVKTTERKYKKVK